MPSSSFYVDGETYSTALVTSADQPGTTTPSQAPSSFYPDGTVYDTLASADVVAAEFAADLQQAAASAAAAATQAINAAASAGLALQDETAAANSAQAAATSATNAASSASAAATSDSDAQTQATNAASSASNAYTNAQSAQSSATAASTSATNAATSATNASSSATAAAGSASAASGSASAASTSASNASTSATNAASSASAAATSASNAAAAVQAAAGTATPLVDGTAAVGTSAKWAHEDHKHPTDTTRAPLASPTFTGTPAASTATAGDSSTNIATTAFVAAAILANPGGFGNNQLAKTAAYSLANADKYKTLALGGSACYTLTVAAPAGYDANFMVFVLNTDSTRGKDINVNGTHYTLWPLQSAFLMNVGGSWYWAPLTARWRTPGPLSFYVDPTNGSDTTSDGLATGAGAFRSLGRAVTVLYQQIDANNSQPTIYVAAGATILESIVLSGQITGCNVFAIMGNGGQFTWKPATTSSAFCLQIGDNAEVMIANIYFDSNGTANGQYAHIWGHQYGVVDVGFNSNGGITFGTANGTRAIYWDYNGQLNINQACTWTGAFNNAIWLNGTTTCNLNGVQTPSGVTSISRFFYITNGSVMDVQGNVSFPSGWTGASAPYVGNGSVCRNTGGVGFGNVGGTPTTGPGGVYSTTV